MGGITRLCDSAVALESFKGSERETNPLYKDYHGEKRARARKHTCEQAPRCLSSPTNATHAHTHTQAVH